MVERGELLDIAKIKKIASDFNELVMFKHSVFALPFIFIAMIVASSEVNGSVWFGWRLFFLAILAAVSARNFAMGFNRLIDRDVDKNNPRTATRPSVDGRISASLMQAFVGVNAFIFIGVAYLINDLALYLSIPFLCILGGYSYFKRFSELAHLILGLSLGLAPIAGVVAVSEVIPMWSLLLSCGVVFWVAGFDLLYSLQDIEFDTNNALFSIPSRYGSEATLFISLLFHGITILFWLLFAIESQSSWIVYLGIVIAGLILAKEQQIVRKDFTKIDRAFFTLNGYLGVFLLGIVLLDRIVS